MMAQKRLEEMLLEGLASGPMTEMTAADWESIRDEVRRRTAVRRAALTAESAEDAEKA